MEILGYMSAILMGFTLGLIGAGGSILTVPILVYLLGVKPIVATGYSLLVVGSAAFAGATRYWRNDLVNMKAVLLFAVPAMLTVLITRTFIVPAIPDLLLGISKDVFIMLLFAVLMILAAGFMLRPAKVAPNRSHILTFGRSIKLTFGSAGVGLLTGMVGAGGGFLIIPTLIALFGLSMKEAIGTSLAIIAINSLVGFKGDIAVGIPFDWHLITTFLTLTLLGMWLGTTLSKRFESQKLKKLFGVFTLLIGLAVLTEEMYALFNVN